MSEKRSVPQAWNVTKIAHREQAEVSLVLGDQLASIKLLLTEPEAQDTLFVS